MKSLEVNLFRSGGYCVGNDRPCASVRNQNGAVLTEKHVILYTEIGIVIRHRDLQQITAAGKAGKLFRIALCTYRNSF